MLRITKVQKPNKPEKRYRSTDVAFAVGLTEKTVSSWMTNHKISTKIGVNLAQIKQIVDNRRRGEGVRWSDVEEIRERLADEYGYIIEECPNNTNTNMSIDDLK